MRLYIANTTKKLQIFVFRRPDSLRPNDFLELQIPPGQQRELRINDLTLEKIKGIVEPHRKYGLVPVEEVVRMASGEFVGMCYSVDKVVPLEKLQMGLQHNDEILVKFGENLRQAAAVAMAKGIEETMQVDVAELEVSIEEEKPDEHKTDGDALGKQTIVVTREAPESKPIKTLGKRPRVK